MGRALPEHSDTTAEFPKSACTNEPGIGVVRMRTIRSATPATGCGTTDKTTKACVLDIFQRCAVAAVQFRIIAPRVETSTGPVVRIYGSSRGRSDGAQIVRRGLTRPSI